MHAELAEHGIFCPYCGEQITVMVDRSETGSSYIEDCQVCCRPIHLTVDADPFGHLTLQARHENE